MEAEEGRGARGSRRVYVFFLSLSMYALLTFIYSYIKYVKHPTNDDGTGVSSSKCFDNDDDRTTYNHDERDSRRVRFLSPGVCFFSIY